MYAVIVTGGKQYRVMTGETLRVEKLDVEAGSTVELDNVLMLGDGENITIGTPGLGLPAEYHATGTTCHQALAAAVQLFHDTAHAYPGAIAYAPQ